MQECEYEISQKGELVARLENKTREISQMLSNLNKITTPTPPGRGNDQKQSAKPITEGPIQTQQQQQQQQQQEETERIAEPETSAKQ